MTVILVEKSELDGIAKYVATRIFELVLHATQSHQLISNRIYIRHGQSHHLITLRNNFELEQSMPVEAGDQSPMSAPNIYMNHSESDSSDSNFG